METGRSNPDFPQLIVRRKKSVWKLLREVLDHGIRVICNSPSPYLQRQVRLCGFAVNRFDPGQRHNVPLTEAEDVIDIAARNHIGCYLVLWAANRWFTRSNIYEFNQSKLIHDDCMRCMIDCYRDPRVLQFLAVNLSAAYNNLKHGRLVSAAKNLCDRRNLSSLKTIWDNRKWIANVWG